MSICKNQIPILEFDPSPSAILTPDHENLDLKLPERAVFAFLGDTIDRCAADMGCEKATEFQSITKAYPIYVAEHNGLPVCICQAPVGAAPAVQILDWLIGYGVKKIISAGSCGVLTDMPENLFLVPRRALRDEGASYHYAPPSRFIEVSGDARAAIEKTLAKWQLPYREVTTWSTDGFFRETRDMVEYRRDEGCSVVEMECSALAACAAFRGCTWGELLFTGDSLASPDRHDMRDFGHDSHGKALLLCLDAVTAL